MRRAGPIMTTASVESSFHRSEPLRSTRLPRFHGNQSILFRLNFNSDVLVLDLGCACMDLQPYRAFAQSLCILIRIARNLHAIERHANGSRFEMRQNLRLMPDMWIEVRMRQLLSWRALLPRMVIPHASRGRNDQDAVTVSTVSAALAPKAHAEMVLFAHESRLKNEPEV